MQLRTNKIFLSFLGLAVFALTACTDKRAVASKPLRQVAESTVPTTLRFIRDVVPNGESINVLSMTLSNGDFYLTGFPFGVARWNVSSDAVNPTQIWSVANNQNFFPNWTVDAYASRSIGVWQSPSSANTYVYTSGVAGTTVIDASTTVPRLALRKPGLGANNGIVQDVAYSYTGIILHPFVAIFMGFQADRFLFSRPAATLANGLQTPYSAGGGATCCVKKADEFAGYAFLPRGRDLLYLKLENSTTAPFSDAGVIDSLQAQTSARTPNYLYVLHVPSAEYPAGMAYPKGIYRFNQSGDQDLLIRLPLDSTPRLFGVTPGDKYIYMNEDGQRLNVYEIVQGT